MTKGRIACRILSTTAVALVAFTGILVQARGQNATDVAKPVEGRIEVDTTDHCFTVRLYLSNTGKESLKLAFGAGEARLVNLPRFTIKVDRPRSVRWLVRPPSYSRPPRRARRPCLGSGFKWNL